MSRPLTGLAVLVFLVLAACKDAPTAAIRSPSDRPLPPSIMAQPPPGVRLRAPVDALLSDQAVGAPRRGGRDHVTAAEGASQQPDQAAALAEYVAWGWLDGATRSWANADETIVETARPDGAVRAFGRWSADIGQAGLTAGDCSPAATVGLDDCRLGTSADRAVVVGRLGAAVFRLQCPVATAERLTIAQAAALHA
jgi:hypothetical protein